MQAILLYVLEFYRLMQLDGRLQQINRIIDCFICGLSFTFNVLTSLELLCLMRTCQGRNLFNKSQALAL